MKREAIIHIGTPKTGSTSIQNVLTARQAELLAQGVFFPLSPTAKAGGMHTYLTYAVAGGKLSSGDGIWGGQAPADRLAQMRTELAAELTALPPHVDRVIFSDERLSSVMHTAEQMTTLRDFLAPYFDSFSVLVYLRRQDLLLASQYSQMLRMGSVRDPETSLTGKLKYYYEYDRMLDVWASVFGDAAINLRIYERGPDGNFDSVQDFLSYCRVALDLSGIGKKASLNTSFDLAGQRIVRTVGRILQQRSGSKSVFGPAWNTLAGATTKALPGRGWSPTRAEAIEFMRRFEAGNELVRARFCPDRPSLFSTDFSNLPELREELSPDSYFDGACRVLAETLLVLEAREQRSGKREKLGKAGPGPGGKRRQEKAAKPAKPAKRAKGKAGGGKRKRAALQG
jgi:hypothetical protein